MSTISAPSNTNSKASPVEQPAPEAGGRPVHTNRDETGKRNVFDTIAYWIVLALAFALPLFLVPSTAAPFLLTKTAVAGTLTFLATICFVIARLKDQSLRLPLVLTLGTSWLVPLAYLASALFQRDGGFLPFGTRIEVDSIGFMVVCALALSLTALLVNTRERVLQLFFALLASGAATALIQFLIFFARSDNTLLGMYLPSMSVIGSLNDLATFFGLVIVVSLVTLTYLPLTNILRAALAVSLVVGAFFLATVNLTALWWIVGVFALVLFVYSVSYSRSSAKNGKASLSSNMSVASLVILALAAVFIFGSDGVTGALARSVNVGELDVRPSWRTTVDMGATVLSGNPIFGSGPGSFGEVWAQHRPVDVEQTAFSGVDFSFGIGVIPTSFITTGVLGAVAWLVFLGSILLLGVRRFIGESADTDHVSAYLRTCSFLAAVYLWVLMIIQVPSPALIVYAFLFSGLFIATLEARGNGVRIVTFSFRDKPKFGFLATLVLTAALLASVSGLYSIGSRYMADSYFQRASIALDVRGDVSGASEHIAQALTLSSNDTYYRLASRINSVQLQQILAENRPPEEIRDRFQATLGTAIANARAATEYNAQNYQNWVTLGSVYQSIVPLGIEGAYESAVEAIDRALALRPQTPSLLLAKATLARATGNTEEAKKLVTEAISVRNQYTDAIFLLAQLQIEENNIEEAIRSVEAAVLFDQQNPVGYFQLGLLRYSTQDYAGAATAFERAVALNEVYANARYFLGLSYHRLGQREQALAQFRRVQETNQDNQEVKLIIDNLSAGREPFASLEVPAGIENEAAQLDEAGQDSARPNDELPPELTR